MCALFHNFLNMKHSQAQCTYYANMGRMFPGTSIPTFVHSYCSAIIEQLQGPMVMVHSQAQDHEIQPFKCSHTIWRKGWRAVSSGAFTSSCQQCEMRHPESSFTVLSIAWGGCGIWHHPAAGSGSGEPCTGPKLTSHPPIISPCRWPLDPHVNLHWRRQWMFAHSSDLTSL